MEPLAISNNTQIERGCLIAKKTTNITLQSASESDNIKKLA